MVKTFFLRVRVEGENTWEEAEIFETLVIGRSEDCDFVLADRLASRKHAHVAIKNGEPYLTDLNSSNGTKINGQRIQANVPRRLSEGEYFSIGHSLCQVVSSKPEDPYRLWYRIEERPWQEITFTEDIIIGRGDDVGLQVQEGHISRNHAVLKVAGGNFYLQDLGSQNGTYLENQRLAANQPIQIFPGQYFKIGRATFTVADVQQQDAFHQTVADFSSTADIPIYRGVVPAQQDYEPARKKKAAWPWLLGIGGILMMCVCVVVIGGLFLLDRAAGIALEDMNQVADIVEENQEEIGELLNEGLETVEEAEELLPEEIEEALPDAEDLTGAGEEVIEDLTDIATETPEPAASMGRKWLVMLYQNADDENLEFDITFDVNTAEKVGSNEEVAIVAQLDRYSGSYTGDGDWSGSRRYYLTPDGDIDIINSTISSDLGEVDSGDVNTLVEFVLWAMETYPAENYALVMSDHGAGWFGGYTDGDNGNQDGIYLPALESALQYITNQTGVEKLDILGFDACLMAELEVWSAVARYADIGVASEETESATGWAYSVYLQQLIDNPSMSPEDLSKAIVNTFVVDDLAYQLYGGNPDNVMQYSTLSAIRLNSVPTIVSAVDGLAVALQNVDQSYVAEARSYTRAYLAFDSYEPFFLDLVHFAQMACMTTTDAAVCGASAAVEEAVNNAMIIEKHGSAVEGSNGVTIYFPDSEFFEVTKDNTYGFAYRVHAIRFTEVSTWDEFLDYHYQIIERMP